MSRPLLEVITSIILKSQQNYKSYFQKYEANIQIYIRFHSFSGVLLSFYAANPITPFI